MNEPPRLYAHIHVLLVGPHQVSVHGRTLEGGDCDLKPMVRTFLQGSYALTVKELREALQAAQYVTRTMVECLDQEYP